jgi:Tol biopolymer transport system component
MLWSVSKILLLLLAAAPVSSADFVQERPGGASRNRSERALAAEVQGLGWIIYSARSEQGDWDLFACRPDGSEQRNLTRTPETNEAAPQFSRDGRRLLYRRLPLAESIDGNRYGAQGELVIAASDGSNPTSIGQPGEFPWASWSPDGKQIACLDIKGISIVDLTSRRVVRTLPRRGFFQQMTWSPDGKWLAGVANSFGAGWSVARMEVATGRANAVSGADCCTPDWFGDSRALIYSNRPPGQKENHGNGWTQLWMAAADGQDRRLLYGEDGRHVYGGHVSTDGKYVIFTGNMQEDGDPRRSGAPMGLMRLADAPIVGGESQELRMLHPQAKRGPVLVLPAGWEPCWTAAGIDRSSPASVRPPDRDPPKEREGPQPLASGDADGAGALAAEVRDKGWIAYSALSEQGDWDLVLIRPDGSKRRPITQTRETHEAGVRFSPDGKRILFYRIPRSDAVDNNTYGTYDLVIADVDGTNATALGRGFAWASWGSDGARLACLDQHGVRIIDAASRRVLKEMPRKGLVQQLVWSADGQWLAGTANGLGPYWNIGRMEATSGQVNLVSEPERYNCTPDWMPDSRRLLYSRGIVPEAGGFAEMWLASADGKERRMVYAEENRHIYGSCPSPDGRYLVFTRSEADLGPVDNSRTRMAVVRLSDTPMVGGASEALKQKYPKARRGPRLDLPMGWEPHWTFAEIPDASIP